MSKICIETHAPALEEDYNKLVEEGFSEKVAAITVALIEYEKLIEALNNLKTSVGENPTVYTSATTVALDNEKKINEEVAVLSAELEKERSAKIAAIEKNKPAAEITINDLKDLDKLTEEQKKKLKQDAKEQIAKLPDDVFFLTHLTQAEENLNSILANGLNTGVAIESTTNVSTTKEALLGAIEAIIDGKVRHAGASNLVILAFPNTLIPFEGAKKADYTEAVSNFIAENYVEDFGKKIPAQYNIASFTNGEVNIVGETKSKVEDTTSEETQKIQDEYNTKIEVLKKGGLSSTQKLEKRIKAAIEAHKLSMTYVGETYDDIVNKQPTKEELAEYADYLEKIQNSKRKDKNYAVRLNPSFATATKADIGLTKEELVKFQALNFKLAQWRMLDGAVTGEQESIADLIEILNQLKTTLAKDTTKSEITKQESIDILETEEMRAANDATQVSFTQVHDVVTAKMVQVEGVRMVRFSDLNIATIVGKMGVTPTIIDPKGNSGKATAALIEEFGKKEGTQFVFDGVTFTIGTKGRISVKEEEFNSVKGQLNLTPLSSSFTHGTYVPVYQSTEQGGDMTQASSDFVHKSTNGSELPYTPDALYETEEGEPIRFQIRMDDSYNVQLINKYKSSKKTAKDQKELEDNLVINTIKHLTGEVTGSLKATNRTENLNFLNIRKAAFLEVMKSIKTGSLNVTLTVPATVRAQKVILGIPNMTVRQTAEGYEPVNKDFDTDTVKQVVNTGYVQNGKSTLSRDGKGVRFDFVTKISKDNPTKKIPIIVFKYGEKIVNGKVEKEGILVAFPVSLISTPNSQASEIEQIMNSQESDADKVKLINQALIKNNIEPRQFELTDLNPSKVAAIITAMDSIQDFVSAEDLAQQDYDVNQLITQAQIAIDLTKHPIGAPKLVMDLSSYAGEDFQEPEATEEEVVQEEEKEAIINSQVNQITKELVKLNKKMNALDKKVTEAEAIYESQKAALTKSRAKIGAFNSISNTRDKTVGKLDAQIELLDEQIVELQNLLDDLMEEASGEVLVVSEDLMGEVSDILNEECV